MAIAHDRLGTTSAPERQERDLHVAWLLGLTPDRVRTMRRVHAKCSTSGVTDDAAVARRMRLAPQVYECWRRLEQLDDDALAAEMRSAHALARRIPASSRRP